MASQAGNMASQAGNEASKKSGMAYDTAKDYAGSAADTASDSYRTVKDSASDAASSVGKYIEDYITWGQKWMTSSESSTQQSIQVCYRTAPLLLRQHINQQLLHCRI